MSRKTEAVGIGCGFVALAGLVGAAIVWFAVAQWPAREAAHAFLSDVRGARWSEALQWTSARYQARHDAAALERSVRALGGLAAHTDANFVRCHVEADEAILDGTLEGPGGEAAVAVELRHADGHWYVDAVVLEGTPLE